MSNVIIDKTTLAKLNHLRDEVVFCDESGNTLGWFLPDPSRNRALYENLECPLSQEELNRRAEEGGGRPLAEILADLEKGMK